MTEPTRLHDLATEILAALVTRLEAASVVVPPHRFVSVGPPAYDCELFAVAYGSLEHALPGQGAEPVRCSVPRAATYQVHYVRCVPVPEGQPARVPTGDELNASAREILTAGWVMAKEVVNAYKAGEFANSTPRDDLVVAGQLVVGPDGGFVGVRQDLTVQT